MQRNTINMKKLLLATTIAGAMAAMAAPAAAQTGVTVSGLVDVFAGSLKNAGDTDRKSVVDSGGMTTSWFGFKGTEDLGGGLKAHFLLTSFFQADTGVQGRPFPDTLFSRDANVGLSGNFGAVSLGRELAPHFLPTILFNPFGDSYTFAPLILHADVPTFNSTTDAPTWSGSIAGDTGWSNSIRYTTPNIGGMTANIHYQFGEVAGDTGTNNIGVNMLYFRGPFAFTAFYHNVDVGNPLWAPGSSVAHGTATNQKAWMLGGSYELSMAKLFATYGQTKHDIDLEDKTISLGASVPVGQGKIMAAWAQTRRSGVDFGAEQKRNTTSIGYDYNLSKRTDLYAVYMNDRITDLDSGNSFGLGMRHRF
ncbi:porin [Noviherbaspirillum agri]